MIGSNVEPYRQKLLAKQQELAAAMVRAETEIPEQADLARLDYGDRSNSDYSTDSLLQQLGQESEQLSAVESALRRVDDGSYGTCAECAEPIEQKRLEAVPWAALCFHCQKLKDEERTANAGAGGESSRVTL